MSSILSSPPNAVAFDGNLALESTDHGLAITNKLLRDQRGEICRLLVARRIHFPNQPENVIRDQREHFKIQAEAFGDQDPMRSRWFLSRSRCGFFNDIQRLDRELARLHAMKREYEDSFGARPDSINASLRPHPRSLSAQHLPDDVLFIIFELLEGRSGESRTGRADIISARLVCRRFCNVASHFLVREISIGLDEASLARMEEISHHPTIARGVRTIRITLRFYNSSFTDFQSFAFHQIRRARDYLYFLRRDAEYRTPDGTSPAALQERNEAHAHVVKLQRLAGMDLAGEGVSADKRDLAVLLDIHREYIALLEGQMSMLKRKRLSHCLGSAMARMPRARSLVIRDANPQLPLRDRYQRPESDLWTSLRISALEPLDGFDVLWALDMPSYGCILDIFATIRNAGVYLTSIDIWLRNMRSSETLVPSQEMRQDLSEGMRLLKSFNFRADYFPNDEAMNNVREFLSTSLSTARLQQLSLAINIEAIDPASLDLGGILYSVSGPHLKEITLSGLGIDFPTLLQFMGRLPEMIRRLHLSDVYLLSDTWREALDVLRAKTYGDVKFEWPEGGEFESTSEDDLESIFGDIGQDSAENAELYITRALHRNPLEDL
ncbi:hypothetical protein PWT90_09109 [Aphanocladium album]|nr:hypothetical protein PWT90_09109 [Aphanocladium album]